ncbi:MAG: fructose-6-phosphate aldolase [Bacteroidota bacterium]
MYILKVKGKAKIPDYIQIRDENFTLKAYFRVDRPEKSLSKFGFDDQKL